METLIILIIIFVAVLSTPLSLKKLIDHANRRQKEMLQASEQLQKPEQPLEPHPEPLQNPEQPPKPSPDDKL